MQTCRRHAKQTCLSDLRAITSPDLSSLFQTFLYHCQAPIQWEIYLAARFRGVPCYMGEDVQYIQNYCWNRSHHL